MPVVIFVVALISLPILSWLRYHALLIASWSTSYTVFWQIAVTLILLIASFFIILSKKYGQGIDVGHMSQSEPYLVIGYLLKSWVPRQATRSSSLLPPPS